MLGNLLTVTDNGGNQTRMAYDNLGRKITMHDPDMGDWVYSYDANGNLKMQTDARGQIIRYWYDGLNRLTYKDFPEVGIHVITNTYDEAWSENPKGRLTTMADPSGQTKYYYDPLGRTKKVTKRVDNYDYTVQYAYDGLGRLQYLTYPDNDVVRYIYNTGGNLAQVADAGVVNYAAYSRYNAFGQPGRVTFRNGVTTDYTYVLSNNRLLTILTSKSGQPNLLDLSYGYDNVGNITGITDNAAHTQPPLVDDKATYTYGAQPHAVAQDTTNGITYSYDSNGNMTSDGAKTIQYNCDNMPVSITSGGITTSIVYDGGNSRVKKTYGSGTATTYIGKLYECNGTTCAKYIFANGQKIAHKVGTSDIVYYHPDHLGSTSAVSNTSGVKVEDAQYYPFGEKRLEYGTTPMSHKYTGQEFDASSNSATTFYLP